jgi:hypothetical protein
MAPAMMIAKRVAYSGATVLTGPALQGHRRY